MKRKMKKIFTSIPFIVGVFFVIYAAFGLVYFQKQAECRDLQSQITLNRTILEKPHSSLKEWENQLSAVQSEWASLPNTKQSIELADALVDVAQESNVQVVSIGTSLPIEMQDMEMEYTVLPFDVAVQGNQGDIMVFVRSLAQSPELLRTLEIRSVNIISTTCPLNPYGAKLQLYIYTIDSTGEQE